MGLFTLCVAPGSAGTELPTGTQRFVALERDRRRANPSPLVLESSERPQQPHSSFKGRQEATWL